MIIFCPTCVLQHFPMYRDSDKNCNEPDEAPEDLKKLKFRERWECLSQEATSMVGISAIDNVC